MHADRFSLYSHHLSHTPVAEAIAGVQPIPHLVDGSTLLIWVRGERNTIAAEPRITILGIKKLKIESPTGVELYQV